MSKTLTVARNAKSEAKTKIQARAAARGAGLPSPTATSLANLAATRELPLEQIAPHPQNPRQSFDGQKLKQLADSIARSGVLQPVLVRPAEDGAGRAYQLVCGERRFRAAQLAKLKTIPAAIRNLSDAEALEVMIVENEEREDLNPIELARGLVALVKPRDAGGAGLTHAQAAERFGHQEEWATNLMRLLALPPHWQSRVATGEMPPTFARALVPYAKSSAVLTWLDEQQLDFEQLTRTGFEGVLDDAVREATRPLADGDCPFHDYRFGNKKQFGRLFKLTPELEGQLGACELPVRINSKWADKPVRAILPRATNVELYDREQAAALAAKIEKRQDRQAQGKKGGAKADKSGQPTPAELKRRREEQDRYLTLRVAEWAEGLLRSALCREFNRTQWEWLARVFLRHWTRTAEAHNWRGGANDSEGEALVELGQQSAGDEWATLLAWAEHDEDPISACDLLDRTEARRILNPDGERQFYVRRDVVWGLAKIVKLDLVAEWKGCRGERLRAFFNLHTAEQLSDLKRELGEFISATTKKGEQVGLLAEAHEGRPYKLPQVLAAARPSQGRKAK